MSKKTEWVYGKDWAEQRPLMLMIDAKSWTEIKKDWLKACRLAGPDCNIQVNSVDKVIRQLDDLANFTMKK